MRGRVVFVLLILVLLFMTYAFFAPIGYLAVRDACTREGGLQISQTDNVEGYLNLGESIDGKPDRVDCWRCGYQVADREYVFVDFERTEAMDAGAPGLYRFELAPALPDRGNCVGGNYDGLPAGQCVTARRLETPTSARYGYRREWVTRKALLGVEIRERGQFVYDLASGKPIATHKYFDYQTPAERLGNTASSYHCEKSRINPDDSRAFLDRVLHVKASG